MTIPLETTIYLLTGCTVSNAVSHYPPPDSLPLYTVCPSCKTEVAETRLTGQYVAGSSYQCRRCGDVIPIRSAVKNPALPVEKSGAICPVCGHPESAHFVGCTRTRDRIAGLLGFASRPVLI